jgi:hypothetical protein
MLYLKQKKNHYMYVHHLLVYLPYIALLHSLVHVIVKIQATSSPHKPLFIYLFTLFHKILYKFLFIITILLFLLFL